MSASSHSRQRPRILAALPYFIPSTILTVVKPLTLLHRSGHILADITLESHASRRHVERADVVVFSRNSEPEHGHLLEAARSLGKPIVYDIDDNLFELPIFYPRERRYLTDERVRQMEHYVRAASLVRVYSEPMRERVGQLNQQVVRVDGPVDWSLLPSSPPRRDPKRLRIVYATSRFDDELAQLFMEDLQRILDTYRQRVTVCFWGFDPPALRGHPAVEFRPFIPDYDRFFRQFARAGFDIGLAPLRNDVFHRSKSNNKFREYAAARIAGVYSNVEVYSECVADGRTGLLVSDDPGAWFRALSLLIENAEQRTAIQSQAFDFARAHYGLERMQSTWLEEITDLIAHPRAAPLLPDDASVSRVLQPSAPNGGRGAVSHAIHLLGAMRRHGLRATVNRIRRTAKDWRLLLRVKWQLYARRLLFPPDRR